MFVLFFRQKYFSKISRYLNHSEVINLLVFSTACHPLNSLPRREAKSPPCIYKTYGRLLAETDLSFTRYLYEKINWDNRLIVIKGVVL